VICPSCNAVVADGEVPPMTVGLRASRYIECSCGTKAQLSALRGDTAWTPMAYKPKGAFDWFPMPSAKGLYRRLDARLKGVAS
jgi:hypothetical protein